MHVNKIKNIQNDIRMSYSAANSFPAKVLAHPDLVEQIKKTGKIPIFHVQLNPINQCNFNCSFCSCRNRDKSLVLPLDRLMKGMTFAKTLGCKSTTLTGGGEPCLHKDIEEIICGVNNLGIDVGLVNNGSALNRLESETLKHLTWSRISCSDILEVQAKKIGGIDVWFKTVQEAVERGSHVDWAFSYVTTGYPNYKLLKRLIEFSSNNNFTHIRIVNDIYDSSLSGTINSIKRYMIKHQIDDGLVNYQDRSEYTVGAKDCLVSLLRPVIGADGKVYACCGSQYSLATPTYDYEPRMCMGQLEDLPEIYNQQKFFHGEICAKCYYDNYNWALKTLLSKLEHINFV
jgi:organic radical activating enzyme